MNLPGCTKVGKFDTNGGWICRQRHDEQIIWLEISMQNLVLVQEVDCFGGVNRYFQLDQVTQLTRVHQALKARVKIILNRQYTLTYGQVSELNELCDNR